MITLPSVAVVILNWNGREFLKKFLPPLLASDYENLRIIVADNASTDGSVQFLREHFPEVRIIINPANEGFAKGYNSALRLVEADYYVLLNSDVLITPNWIAPVILLMESNEKIGACQPKILSYQQSNYFEYAGAAGGWIDGLGYPFCRGRIFDYCEKDSGQYDHAIPVFWASGASLFVRASVFHEVGGFDETFFAHQEEIDLCWRIKRAGYEIYAEPASQVLHVGGGTLPMGSRFKVFLNFRNNLIMLSKNLPVGEAIFKIPARIVLDIIAAFQAIIKTDFNTFISIFKAIFHYFGWLIKAKSANRLPKIKLSRMTGVFDGSVVWAFFIKNKKTFSEIVSSKE